MLITFASTRDVIKAEELLRGSGIRVTALPMATDVTARCGIALQIDKDDIERVRNILGSFMEIKS